MSAIAEGQASKPRILVVDDEDSIQYVISSVFARKGYDVVSAGNGEDAVRAVEGSVFDLALLDIVLPGLSGLQVLERLREQSASTPVIMMTSHASAETAIEALRQGAYDYLHKPFELDELVTVVERAIEKRKLTIQNEELVNQMRHQNEKLEALVRRLQSLNQAGMGMSGIASLPDLLEFFVDLVQDELQADRVSLMLLNNEGTELRIAAARGLSEEIIRETRVRLGEGVSGRVAKEGQLIVADPSSDEVWNPGAGLKGAIGPFAAVPVSLALPIRTSRDILGVLNVTNRRGHRQIEEEDASYLWALAGQAAVAIERASQSDRLREADGALKSTQDQLVAASRLNGLGEIAAGVAHDFNNILNGILTRSQLIRRMVGESPDAAENLATHAGIIEKLALQGAESIRRIQNFTILRSDSAPARTRLDQAARTAIDLTAPKWREECHARGCDVRIETEWDFEDEIVGSPQEIAQAITNLIFNGVEAMPHGGVLRIRTYKKANEAIVEVSDTGAGMPRDVQERAFEPFFTTKPDGQGLGLSVVHTIVSRLNGRVEVESIEGSGACVRLAFSTVPAYSGASALGTELADGVMPAERARVLVVDDDPGTLEVCRDLLEHQGHEVQTADSGRAAIERLSKVAFDLVVTDLAMPELTGWDVARAAKQGIPGIPVVLLSGWKIPQPEAEVRAAGVDLVLAKPVGVDAFIGSIHKLLTG